MSTAAVARGTMPLAGHVREARGRAVRAAGALLLGVIAGYLLSGQVLDALRAPVEQLAQSRSASLNYATVSGAFDLRLRIALLLGLALASPVWLWQLLGFVGPGLTRRERRGLVGFVAAALPLFAAGCALGLALFGHLVLALTGFSSARESTILDAGSYVDFVLTFVVATGIALVLPVLVVLLNRLRLLPARVLLRGWRLIVVLIVLFSGLVTPAADVMSMLVVAAPMALLFGAAVALCAHHDRRLAAREVATCSV